MKKWRIKKSRTVVDKTNKIKGVQIGSLEVSPIKQTLKQINEIGKAIKELLIDGSDYGIIPGTKKPTLFKSGAYKIKMLYRLKDNYKIIDKAKGKDDNGEYVESYTFKCSLTTYENEKEVATGIGHISTDERGSKNKPTNTLLKVGKKRALIDAIVSIANLSEIFTQDNEENELSTENAKNYLAKYEKIATYTTIYKILMPTYSALSPREKEKHKAPMKAFIDKIIKKLEIPQIPSDHFTREHQRVLIDAVKKNKEKFNG